MAYTVFPQKTADILTVVKSDAVKGGEIVELFTLLKRKYKTIKTPINIDPGKLSIVNVTRELQGTADLKTIQKEAKLSKVKIKFGAGSAGNRGVANRGNLFENNFARAINDYWGGDKVEDMDMLRAIEDLAKTYNFKRFKTLNVKEEGALNTKRPLAFKPGPFIYGAELSRGHLDFEEMQISSTKFFLNLLIPAQAIIAALSPQYLISGNIASKFISLDKSKRFSLTD